MRTTIDIQFGCCQLNKKLLLKTLDGMLCGEEIDLVAENSDSVRSAARKYIEGMGCEILSIEGKNGTCVITVRRKG